MLKVRSLSQLSIDMAVAEPVTIGEESALQLASRYTVASAGQVMAGVSGALLSVTVMVWA